MLKNTHVSRFVQAVVSRTGSFFQEELGVSFYETVQRLENVQWICLKFITAIQGVADSIDMYLAFSFDETLAEHILKTLAPDGPTEECSLDCLLEDAVGEVVNIIIGNSTEEMADSPVIALSPPILLTEARRITSHNGASFYTAEMRSDHGNLCFFCVGPKELFDEELDSLKADEGGV